MKTNDYRNFLAAVLATAALVTTGCAEKKEAAQTPSVPSSVATASVPNANLLTNAPTASMWANIQDVTYEARADFIAGITRMETAVDEQIRVLNAKRSSMSGTVDTRAWDLAMKELDTARTNLRGSVADAKNATPETWNQVKDKVGRAWVTAQDAISKVKSSTTAG